MKILYTIALICFAGMMTAQVTIKVEVSADTIAPGQMVEVIYTIDNGEGRFEPPDLTGLPIISGPNTSSSFMIQNGKKSSSQSYTYIFKPLKNENIKIPEAYYVDSTNRLTFQAMEIIVNSAFDLDAWAKEQLNNPSVKEKREKKKF